MSGTKRKTAHADWYQQSIRWKGFVEDVLSRIDRSKNCENRKKVKWHLENPLLKFE